MGVKDSSHLEAALERAEASLREVSGELRRARAAAAPAGVTVRELASEYGVSEEAVRAFVQAAAEVLGDRPLSVAAARRGAVVAASAGAWEGELGPLLSSAQVRELLGGVSRQRVDELLRARRLIGLREEPGRRRFPAFQFSDGRPLPAVVDAFWILAAESASEWSAASWLVAPDDALDGLTPVAWARAGREPERLTTVARQDAARLAR